MVGDYIVPLGLACAVAAFLCLTNHNIPFANGGSCDPWHFYGRYYLANQPDALPYTREISRIPAFILGFVFTHLLHGVAAEYASFAVLFIAAAFAVFIATRALFGQIPGMVALIFFATQPLVVANFSMTYTEAATALTAIAIAGAIVAGTMSRGLRQSAMLVATGIVWGAAVHAHLESLTMNFIVALFCLDWSRRRVRDCVLDAVRKWPWLILGIVVVTLCLGAINVTVFHGSFLFFLKQFQDVARISIIPFEKPTWYLTGGRGAVFLLALMCIVWQAMHLRDRSISQAETKKVLTVLVPFAVLWVAQLCYTCFDYGLALEYDYWFVWLIPPLCPLLGSMFARPSVRSWLAYTAIALFLVASVAADYGRLDIAWHSLSWITPCLAAAVVFVPAILWLSRYRQRIAMLVTLSFSIILGATVRPENFGLDVWSHSSEHDVYARLDAGMTFLSAQHFPKIPKFWTDGRGQMDETFAYPRAYNYCIIDYVLPESMSQSNPAYIKDVMTFSSGDDLVLVPRDDDELREALTRLAAQGTTFNESARTAVSYAGLSYLIVVGHVR